MSRLLVAGIDPHEWVWTTLLSFRRHNPVAVSTRDTATGTQSQEGVVHP